MPDVIAEVISSLKKWGVQDLDEGTLKFKFLADQKKQENEELFKQGTLSRQDVLDEEVLEAYTEPDPELRYKELVQCASVILLWLESMIRKGTVKK